MQINRQRILKFIPKPLTNRLKRHPHNNVQKLKHVIKGITTMQIRRTITETFAIVIRPPARLFGDPVCGNCAGHTQERLDLPQGSIGTIVYTFRLNFGPIIVPDVNDFRSTCR